MDKVLLSMWAHKILPDRHPHGQIFLSMCVHCLIPILAHTLLIRDTTCVDVSLMPRILLQKLA